jgi:hypothetical protein
VVEDGLEFTLKRTTHEEFTVKGSAEQLADWVRSVRPKNDSQSSGSIIKSGTTRWYGI